MAAGRGRGGEIPLASMSPGCWNLRTGRLRDLPARPAAALIAETSPTRADRQLRPHVAAGPSCRLSCRRRTPHCASRTSRPPERRPRPAAGSWWSDARQSASYRRTTGRWPTVASRQRRPWARDAPSLARSPVPRVPARAMTSQSPATLAVSEAPGTSPGAAVTMAAGPARPGSECARRSRDTTRLAVSIQPPFPSRVIPGAGTGRCRPGQVPRSLNDGPRPVIAPGQSDR